MMSSHDHRQQAINAAISRHETSAIRDGGDAGQSVDEIFGADDVRARIARFLLLLAAAEHGDALRLAGSQYSVWRDIVLTNSDNLEGGLDRIIQMVEHLRANLRSRELEQEFSVANEVYKILRGFDSRD